MKADHAAPSTRLCHSPPVIIANRDPVFHRNEIEDTQSSGLVGIVEADEPQTSQIDVLRRTIEDWFRRLADLARNGLHVLLCDRVHHIASGDTECGHLQRIEPDAHSVAQLTQDLRVSDAGPASVSCGCVYSQLEMNSWSYAPVGENRFTANTKLRDALRTVRPWRVTSCGSCAVASETRFCTFTASMSGLVPSRS